PTCRSRWATWGSATSRKGRPARRSAPWGRHCVCAGSTGTPRGGWPTSAACTRSTATWGRPRPPPPTPSTSPPPCPARARRPARSRNGGGVVRAGGPLNGVVAVVDGRRYELDEVGAVRDGRVQFLFERNRITLRPATVLTERGEEQGSAGRYEEARET